MFRIYLGVVGAVMLFSGCAHHAHAEVREEFRQTVALDADGEFEISNVNGSIEISTWSRNEVQIVATKSANSEAALKKIEIEIHGSADRVEVGTELPKGWNSGGSVSYEITMPATAQLEAETVNGRLTVTGVTAEMELDSVNGAVEANGAIGPVDADTVNGSLTVRYASAPKAGSHELNTVNGGLRVYLPADVAGSFHASTVNGGIHTDFPLEVKKARFGPMSSLDGTLGAGTSDTSFDLATVNGAIRIRSDGETESSVR
jgi:DUF4097 and DUF4098 domain-containing protein YvlB